MPTATRRRSTAADLALVATFAALLAAAALIPAISVGGAVPITLQTLVVMLCGAVLGSKRGALAVLLYFAVGALGLPIFTQGAAGLAPFFGPSVGYLAGFPLAAFATGFIVERLPRRKIGSSIPLIFLAGLASSIIFIHPLGILGMAWRADLTIGQAFLADMVFWPGDIIKNLLMAVVATAVHRAFPTLLPTRARRSVEAGSADGSEPSTAPAAEPSSTPTRPAA